MRLRRSRKVGDTSILLVDGLNMCYRMVHTHATLKHGELGTGVIYGFIKNMYDLVGKYEPEQVIVVWEGKDSRLRRKTMYPEYKAKRKSDLPIPKEDFYKQIDNLKELLYYLGMNNVDVPKFEADDVIAVLSRHFAQERKKVLIVSTDGDMLQLINMWVEVYSPTKELVYNEANFHSLVGMALSDFVDYKCLVGDSSDNIPGVRGIGEKGAKSIIDFLGLRLFMEQDESSVKEKSLKRLFTPEGKAELKLAQDLIDLSSVPLSVETALDNMSNGTFDADEAKDLLMDYNMWSILDNWNDYAAVFGKVE